jgi:integrase
MMAHLRPKTRKYYYGRYQLPWMPRPKDVNLKVSEKQLAWSVLNRIIKEAQMEHEGLIAPKAIREANGLRIEEHLQEFLNDRITLGRAPGYCQQLKSYILAVCLECGWKYPQDIRADQFENWRSKQDRSVKTLNAYLDCLRTFIKWMYDRSRIACEPLSIVEKVKTNGKVSRNRRALTENELANLLAIASPLRRAAYLLGAYCGMRRGEVRELCWNDLDLSSNQPSVRLRASTTKNRKSATLPLRFEIVEALNAIKFGYDPSGKVFPVLSQFRDMKREWKLAGIALVDKAGRVADFHSLRKTFCTMMQNAGVAPRLAQEAMRHSDSRLTAVVYTDTSQLNIRSAVDRLPSVNEITEKCPLCCPLEIVQSSQNVSSAVTNKEVINKTQVVGSVGDSHDMSQSVLKGRLVAGLGIEPRTFRL